MESKTNLQMIQEAVNQLPAEEDIKADNLSTTDNFATVDEEDNEEADGLSRHHNQQRLLSQPLSQLKSLEDNNKQQDNGEETIPSSSEFDRKISTLSRDNEEIIKELKNLKRQNLITHCLLSAMIVVTLTWQLSEVSLILKVKNVLCNPLKSLGGIVRRVLKGNSKVSVQEVMKEASSAKQKQVFEPPTSIPGIKISKIPQLEFPSLDSSDKDLRD